MIGTHHNLSSDQHQRLKAIYDTMEDMDLFTLVGLQSRVPPLHYAAARAVYEERVARHLMTVAREGRHLNCVFPPCSLPEPSTSNPQVTTKSLHVLQHTS
jgi:hypothetical protein